MVKKTDCCENVENLLCLVAENQRFASGKDKLSALIDRFSDYASDELTEQELKLATAAKMPVIPKYKALKELQ